MLSGTLMDSSLFSQRSNYKINTQTKLLCAIHINLIWGLLSPPSFENVHSLTLSVGDIIRAHSSFHPNNINLEAKNIPLIV